METDENEIELFDSYEDDKELNKEDWEEYIGAYKPETGILSLLMLLNDIFLHPKIQSLVSLYLNEKYKNLILLKFVFGSPKI